MLVLCVPFRTQTLIHPPKACGLNLSIFLSKLGVGHVLFERHAGTAILPKAHIINQRTMEIFRQYGIAESILEKGTPPHQMSKVLWQTSLGGDGPLDRKVIGDIDSWGCKEGTSTYEAYLWVTFPLESHLSSNRSFI